MSTETPKEKDPNVFVVEGRASFPYIFTPRDNTGDDGESKKKYSVSILMDKKKHAAQIAALRQRINELAWAKWPDLKGKPYPEAKTCLKDGATKSDTDGYTGEIMFLNASESVKPRALGPNKKDLERDDPRIYPGVEGKFVIKLWTQDNKYGKKINAYFKAFQYLRPGEPLGNGPVNVDDLLTEEAEEEDGDIM